MATWKTKGMSILARNKLWVHIKNKVERKEYLLIKHIQMSTHVNGGPVRAT